MAIEHIVTIGASAGGIDALRTVMAGLPADFPAAVFVVLHLGPESPGVLPQLLDRAGPLPVVHARDHARFSPGHVYVAPPDRHLVLEPGVMRVTGGPRENRFRPAIDPLFRSAAQVYGPRVIGVILTGNLDDGTAGLWAVKQMGGIAVVQDPEDALFPSMPASAIDHVPVDHIVPLADVPALLVQLTEMTVHDREAAPAVLGQMTIEVEIAKDRNAVEAGVETLGPPSPYACPECHGVLLEVKEADRVRFRCHTGHAYSADSLMASSALATDEALWNAVRALEESALLMQRMAETIRAEGDEPRAAKLEEEAMSAHQRSKRIRELTEKAVEPVR